MDKNKGNKHNNRQNKTQSHKTQPTPTQTSTVRNTMHSTAFGSSSMGSTDISYNPLLGSPNMMGRSDTLINEFAYYNAKSQFNAQMLNALYTLNPLARNYINALSKNGADSCYTLNIKDENINAQDFKEIIENRFDLTNQIEKILRYLTLYGSAIIIFLFKESLPEETYSNYYNILEEEIDYDNIISLEGFRVISPYDMLSIKYSDNWMTLDKIEEVLISGIKVHPSRVCIIGGDMELSQGTFMSYSGYTMINDRLTNSYLLPCYNSLITFEQVNHAIKTQIVNNGTIVFKVGIKDLIKANVNPDDIMLKYQALSDKTNYASMVFVDKDEDVITIQTNMEQLKSMKESFLRDTITAMGIPESIILGNSQAGAVINNDTGMGDNLKFGKVIDTVRNKLKPFLIRFISFYNCEQNLYNANHIEKITISLNKYSVDPSLNETYKSRAISNVVELLDSHLISHETGVKILQKGLSDLELNNNDIEYAKQRDEMDLSEDIGNTDPDEEDNQENININTNGDEMDAGNKTSTDRNAN